VNEERMVLRVRELVALGPRMGGTASGDAAAAWRVEAFRAAGLEPRMVLDPERWVHAEESWEVRALGPCAPHAQDAAAPGRLESAWPWGFSPAGAGRAPLSLEPTEGGALLAERPPRRGTEPSPAAVVVDGATNLDGRFPVVQHQRPGPHHDRPVFGVSHADGRALRDALAACPEMELEWELEATIERARPRTVWAAVEAREGAPPGYFLVCAHGDSDSGGPGANDNASGEAIVIEMAGAWAGAVAAGHAPPPPREVRFVIWGTEITSSRAWLERAAEDDAPLLGVLNFDQCGYGTASDQLNVEPDDLEANREFVLQIARVLAEHEGLGGWPARWATNRSLGGTDSYVFSDSETFRRAGLPAVTLYTSAWGEPAEHPRTPGMPGESWSDRDRVTVDFDLHYHSSGDLPENTVEEEPWNMGWCARAGLTAVSRRLEALGSAR
jgi:hypothetical protein